MNAYDKDLGRPAISPCCTMATANSPCCKPGPLRALRGHRREDPAGGAALLEPASLQEAYAGPAEALQRWRELNPD